MAETKIEWTDKVWNPVVGCSKVSAGCANCYAETMANRLAENPATAKRYAGTVKNGKWTGKVNLVEEVLDAPLHWKKPCMVFVDSMSDLFHASIPFTFIKNVFNRMCRANHHTYQILTKRPDRFILWWKWFESEGFAEAFMPRIPKHIWIGTSIENQETADERIPLLFEISAAVRFLSCEPLLGPIDIKRWIDHDPRHGRFGCSIDGKPSNRYIMPRAVDWVICGGESGDKARPMHPNWARSLRDQCHAEGVPFFFKQWGEFAPVDQLSESLRNDDVLKRRTGSRDVTFEDGTHVLRVGKWGAGALLDGREWREFPTSYNRTTGK